MAKPDDFVVDNASGSAVRTDLNNIFDAISINNGFGDAPTQKYKYMWYADTGTQKMSFYKANATDKLDFISLTDGSFFGPNGTAANPSYTFTNSTSTGFFRTAANQIGVCCNAFEIAKFSADELNVSGNLVLAQPAGSNTQIQISAEGVGDEAVLDLAADTLYDDYGLRITRTDTANGESRIAHRGTSPLSVITQEAADVQFRTSNTHRWAIRHNGALEWLGHNYQLTPTGTGTTMNGSILGRGIISRKGTAEGAAIANPYNFYWTGQVLQCWVDESNVGNVSGPTSSDYRIKQNITTQTASGIDKIKQLRPVNYKYKDYSVFKADGVDREGFIAHEVQEVIPSGTNGVKDGDEIQSLNLDAIVSVLTKALQEAVAKIETLEAKVAALEAS